MYVAVVDVKQYAVALGISVIVAFAVSVEL
jgi:hypothetical protein